MEMPRPDPFLGFYGPDSMMWRINREAVLLGAGPCALLLQIAHPSVARGVAEHSTFESDPFSRLVEGVGELTSTDTFGDGLHLPFALGLVVLLALCARRLPGSLTVYSALIVWVTLSAENLNSLERYGLNAFPLVVALALCTADERLDRAVLTISGAGLVGLATLAWLGAYVP